MIKSHFLDLEFPKGMGDQVEKIMEIPGGRVTRSPLEWKIQWGGGVKLGKNPPWGGYGYFLEPHILQFTGFENACCLKCVCYFKQHMQA